MVMLSLAEKSKTHFYPLDKDGKIPTDIVPYEVGQEILIDCIARNIDNGEHKFDEQERIIHSAFPICKETGKPLTFRYGISEDVNCTIGFTDELYHLFQLYIHEDVPFSCRVPLSSSPNYMEKGGAFVPLSFNFRGDIHESHLDIDNNLNVLFTKPSNRIPEEYTIISSIAYSSGTNSTRVVIGDSLTLNLAIRWFDTLTNSGSNTNDYKKEGLPYADGFYKLPLNLIPVSYSLALLGLVGAVVGGIAAASGLGAIFNKNRKYKYVDNETTLGKQD